MSRKSKASTRIFNLVTGKRNRARNAKNILKDTKDVRRSKSFLRKAWKNGNRAYKVISFITMLMDLFGYTDCVQEIFKILHEMGVEMDVDYDNLDESINSDNINIDNISVIDILKRLWNACPTFKYFIFGMIGFFATMIIILLFINDSYNNSEGYLQSIIYCGWFIFTFVLPAIFLFELARKVEDYVENILQSNDPEDFLDDEMTELIEQNAADIVTQITLSVTQTDNSAMEASLANCENLGEDDGGGEDELSIEEIIELVTEFLGPTVLVYVAIKIARSSLVTGSLRLVSSSTRVLSNTLSKISSVISSPVFKKVFKNTSSKFFSKKAIGKMATRLMKFAKGIRGVGLILFLIDLYDPMNINSYLNNATDGMKSYRNKLDDSVLEALSDNNIKPPFVFGLEYLRSTYDPETLDIFSIIYESYLRKTRVDIMKTIENNETNSKGILFVGDKFWKFIYSIIYFESFPNIYTSFFEFLDSIKDLFIEPTEEEIRCRMLQVESQNQADVLKEDPIARDEEIMDELLDIIIDCLINKYYNEISNDLNTKFQGGFITSMIATIKIDNIHYSICLELFDEIKIKIEEITDSEVNPEVIYNIYNVIFVQLSDKRFNSSNIDDETDGINYQSFINELGISAFPDIITLDVFEEIKNNVRVKIPDLETEINSIQDIEIHKYQIAFSKSIIDIFKVSKMFTHYKALSTEHRTGVTLSEEGIRLYREFIYNNIKRDERTNTLHGDLDYNYTSENENAGNINIPTFSKYYRDYKRDSNDVIQLDTDGNKIIELYKLPFDEPIPQLSVGEMLLGKICRHGTSAIDEIFPDDPGEIPPEDDMRMAWENFKTLFRNAPRSPSKHENNIVFEADTQGAKYGDSIESYNLGLCRYLNPDEFCDNEVIMNRIDIDYNINSSEYCSPSADSEKLLNEYDNCMFDYTRTECNDAGCYYNESSVITSGLTPIERYNDETGVNQLLPGKIHNCESSVIMETCETFGYTIICRGVPTALNKAVGFYEGLPESWDAFREDLEESLGDTADDFENTMLVLSDKNLKYNIKKLGKSKSGITIYQWNYLPGLGYDTNKIYIGTTSQELLSLNMDYAVIKNGYYNKYTKEYCDMVNYSLIDVDFKTL